MTNIRVGINGYGTIGRRVAEAVLRQNDMKLVGVTKTKPDYRARLALQKGIAIYLPPTEKYVEDFQKAKIASAGSLDDLIEQVDVIVDSTPELGAEYKSKYVASGKKVIFQGGEEHDIAGLSFVAQCNYEAAVGKQMVRVVSCNTTALCRVMHALDSNFKVNKARVVLARRAADPDEVGKGPIDAVVPDPVTVPSHHGPDVQSVMPNLNITTMAIKIPTTHMHLHSIMTTLGSRPTTEAVIDALSREPRIMLVDSKSGFKSTANIIDYARELNRPRNDVYEAVVWRDSVNVQGDEVYFFLAVHQEAIVTPENIDAIRALSGGYSKDESMNLTDLSLGIAPSHPGV
jgi:glyceraldehyde-3-phosphate dehydrogenase (NAD(P))